MTSNHFIKLIIINGIINDVNEDDKAKDPDEKSPHRPTTQFGS